MGGRGGLRRRPGRLQWPKGTAAEVNPTVRRFRDAAAAERRVQVAAEARSTTGVAAARVAEKVPDDVAVRFQRRHELQEPAPVSAAAAELEAAALTAVCDVIKGAAPSANAPSAYVAALAGTLDTALTAAVSDASNSVSLSRVAATAAVLNDSLLALPQPAAAIAFDGLANLLLRLLTSLGLTDVRIGRLALMGLSSLVLRAGYRKGSTTKQAVIRALIDFVTDDRPAVRRAARQGLTAIAGSDAEIATVVSAMWLREAAKADDKRWSRLMALAQGIAATMSSTDTVLLVESLQPRLTGDDQSLIDTARLTLGAVAEVATAGGNLQPLALLLKSGPNDDVDPQRLASWIDSVLKSMNGLGDACALSGPMATMNVQTAGVSASTVAAETSTSSKGFQMLSNFMRQLFKLAAGIAPLESRALAASSFGDVATVISRLLSNSSVSQPSGKACILGAIETMRTALVSADADITNGIHLMRSASGFLLGLGREHVTSDVTVVECAQSLASTIIAKARNLHSTEDGAPAAASSIGAIVRVLGARIFLNKLREICSDPVMADAWMLPVLRSNIVCDEVALWPEFLKPWEQQLASMNGFAATSLRQQLVALLPALAKNARDPLRAWDILRKELESVSDSKDEMLVTATCDAVGRFMSTLQVEPSSETMLLSQEELEELQQRVRRHAGALLLLAMNLATNMSFTRETRQSAAAVVGPLALAGGSAVASKLGRQVLKRVLAASPLSEESLAALLGLCAVLAPHVDTSSAGFIFRAACAHLGSESAGTQRSAYQTLCNVAGAGHLAADQHVEMRRAILESMPTVLPGAMKARVRALGAAAALTSTSGDAYRDWAVLILPELCLMLRDGSRRGRMAASAALDNVIAGWEREAEAAGNSDGFESFLEALVAGLASRTPHNVAATVAAISLVLRKHARRLAGLNRATAMVEADDELEAECTGTVAAAKGVLSALLPLLAATSAEVARATMAAVRTAVSVLPDHLLREHVGSIIAALFAKSERDRLRHDLRALLDRLVQRLGAEAVAAHMPAEHKRLLHAVCKARARAERRRAAISNGAEEGRRDDDVDDHELQDAESAPDAEADFMEISEDEIEDDDDPEDLLDGGVMRSNISKRRAAQATSGRREVAPFPIDATTGKWIIEEEESANGAGTSSDTDDDDDDRRRRHRIPMETDSFPQNQGVTKRRLAESVPDERALPTRGIGRKRRAEADDEEEPERRMANSGAATKRARVASSGDGPERYASSRAAGDVRRKGTTVEPYAYIQLDPRALNRRQQTQTRGLFDNVLKRRRRTVTPRRR